MISQPGPPGPPGHPGIPGSPGSMVSTYRDIPNQVEIIQVCCHTLTADNVF